MALQVTQTSSVSPAVPHTGYKMVVGSSYSNGPWCWQSEYGCTTSQKVGAIALFFVLGVLMIGLILDGNNDD